MLKCFLSFTVILFLSSDSPKVFSPNSASLPQALKKAKEKIDNVGNIPDGGDVGSDKSDHNAEHWVSGKKQVHDRDRSDDSDRSVSKSG